MTTMVERARAAMSSCGVAWKVTDREIAIILRAALDADEETVESAARAVALHYCKHHENIEPNSMVDYVDMHWDLFAEGVRVSIETLKSMAQGERSSQEQVREKD